MAMFRTSSVAIGVLTLLACSGPEASAQIGRGGTFVGPGSTPQGDILRGEGVFLQGAGLYDYYNAAGNSINADTWMRLNEYVFQSVRAGSLREAQKLAAAIAKNKKNYNEMLDRILNNPEHSDVKRGDALNLIFKELTNPQISESSFRLSPVHISGESIRNIPVFYAPEDATISMQRLTARGKWPVGLRGDKLAGERRAYERAIDNALEQQIEGKLTNEAIQAVDAAVSDLGRSLDYVVTPSRDPRYLEAKNYLKRLEAATDLFKHKAIEQILGEIDKYSGTTVRDLVEFMKRNNLRFGVPDDIGDEPSLYPRLYASLRQQLDLVKVPEAEPRK
jgi:hypothetical protein